MEKVIFNVKFNGYDWDRESVLSSIEFYLTEEDQVAGKIAFTVKNTVGMKDIVDFIGHNPHKEEIIVYLKQTAVNIANAEKNIKKIELMKLMPSIEDDIPLIL